MKETNYNIANMEDLGIDTDTISQLLNYFVCQT